MSATKRKLDDLALLGGSKEFETPLRVGYPNIGDRARLQRRIDDILDRRWLTNNGRYVQELERELARRAGTSHCIAMCNATIALALTARALGLAGEVIVPSFTFVATAHALSWQGITPVFCDIDPRTHNIDPRLVKPLITERTTGILAVHLWGRACEVDALEDVARREHLRLIFDAAHAFGCSRKGRAIGSFGDAEVFSFHATKFVNSFEGGAVATNDEHLAARLSRMRDFGFVDYDEVAELGINGKLTEVAAAMGLTSLESSEEIVEVNRRCHEQFVAELGDLPGLSVVRYPVSESANYQYVVLELQERASALDRDELQLLLAAENVQARRYFYPGCHRLAPYRNSSRETHLPHTDRLAQRVLVLPTGPQLGDDGVERMCAIVRLAMGQGIEIRRRLAAVNPAPR